MTERHEGDRLARLCAEHRNVPYPPGFRGVDIEGVELILLDVDVAVLAERELDGRLDDAGVAMLWRCIAGLDKVLPLIGDEYGASYFARLRAMAGDAAARHLPSAV